MSRKLRDVHAGKSEPPSLLDTAQLADASVTQQAYERVLPELQGLSRAELASINLNIPSAITTVLGVLPKVRALRDQIRNELHHFDIAPIDKLEDYALALSHANAHCLTIGRRGWRVAGVSVAAELRVRAFTLFVHAYSNARRAVTYLRWHEGDADSIAPSLYAGRSNGRMKPSEDQAGEVATSAEAVAAVGASEARASPGVVIETLAPLREMTATPVVEPQPAATGPCIQ